MPIFSAIDSTAIDWGAVAGLLLTPLSVIAALWSVLYARRSAASAAASLHVAEAARIHQVLLNVLMEYRSAEMYLAIRGLWSLHRDHGTTKFVQAYEETRRQQAEAVAKLPPSERLEAERLTLHYQRRLVSQFYAFLGGLYELKIIPKKELYTYWSEGDLKIIPTILIPIEQNMTNALGQTPPPGYMPPTLVRMQALYDDSRQPQEA